MTAGLKVTVEELDRVKIVRLEGRMDTTSTPALEKKLSGLLEGEHPSILLDFEKVDYLSSAGMRLLLSETKKIKSKGGQLVFCRMSDEVMEIIKMAGFERILTICRNETEALKVLGVSRSH